MPHIKHKGSINAKLQFRENRFLMIGQNELKIEKLRFKMEPHSNKFTSNPDRQFSVEADFSAEITPRTFWSNSGNPTNIKFDRLKLEFNSKLSEHNENSDLQESAHQPIHGLLSFFKQAHIYGLYDLDITVENNRFVKGNIKINGSFDSDAGPGLRKYEMLNKNCDAALGRYIPTKLHNNAIEFFIKRARIPSWPSITGLEEHEDLDLASDQAFLFSPETAMIFLD